MAESLFYMCACKDTNLKVLKILNDIGKKEDLTDFITTVQSVQITINKLTLIAKAAPNTELCLSTLKELCQYLKEYEAQLAELNQANKLVRIITSSRNRKQLETYNSKINKKIDEMKEHLKEEIKEKKITRTYSFALEKTPMVDEEYVEEAENRARLALMIEDPDAKSVWDNLFGLDVNKENLIYCLENQS